MTDTAAQFVAHLKEENILDAMTVIKTALSEQARAVVAKTQGDVAATFKLTEKAAPMDDNGETPNDNDDADGKSDADSVAGDPEKKDKE